MERSVLIHGDLLYAATPQELSLHPDSWMHLKSGKVEGIYAEKPELEDCEIRDYGKQMIIPVFADIHLHSVQYGQRGLGMNLELLPWLSNYTFKEEARFEDLEYGRKVFPLLLNELWSLGSLNLCTYSSMHLESSLMLMDMYEEAGFRAYVGKVNMDCCDEPRLKEECDISYTDTKEWLERSKHYKNVKPIITPRFAPSCTAPLLKNLGVLAREHDLPVQTHLNENKGEISWVQELFPESKSYYDVYRSYNLNPKGKTVLAHCIHNSEEELEAMLEDEVFVAHCPASNINLSSGIMPLREMLDAGFNVGLGSDIGAGDRLFMGTAAVDAIRASKLYSLQSEGEVEPVNYIEAFYLATAGGGAFFGECGSFAPGSTADYLVIDDKCWPASDRINLEERLQQFLYLGGADQISVRCMRGEVIEKPFPDIG